MHCELDRYHTQCRSKQAPTSCLDASHAKTEHRVASHGLVAAFSLHKRAIDKDTELLLFIVKPVATKAHSEQATWWALHNTSRHLKARCVHPSDLTPSWSPTLTRMSLPHSPKKGPLLFASRKRFLRWLGSTLRRSVSVAPSFAPRRTHHLTHPPTMQRYWCESTRTQDSTVNDVSVMPKPARPTVPIST